MDSASEEEIFREIMINEAALDSEVKRLAIGISASELENDSCDEIVAIFHKAAGQALEAYGITRLEDAGDVFLQALANRSAELAERDKPYVEGEVVDDKEEK